MYKQYEPKVLERLHREELSVLKEFIRICDKYEIDYFALYGTNIGAVRHQGFIPWDDDIDIGMLRKDYERFLEVAPAEFEGKFKIAGPDCEETFYNLVPHVYKVGTRFSTQYDHGNYNLGIWIDIFVYDYLSPSPKLRKKQLQLTSLWRSLYMVSHVDFYHNSVFKKGNLPYRLAAGAAHRVLKLFPRIDKFFYRQYQKSAEAYPSPRKAVTQFCDTMGDECAMELDELFPLTTLPFEDIEIKVPREYDKILRRIYGDYMELPPLEKRQNHYPYILEFSEESADE